MAAILTLAFTGSDAGTAVAPTASPADLTAASESRGAPNPDTHRGSKCPSAHKAVKFYAGRIAARRAQMGQPTNMSAGRAGKALTRSGCPRYLAKVLRAKAYALRRAHESFLRYTLSRTLHDFVVRDGNRAWHRAVREVQRPYPGTEAWLLSCSASEGGHGRWVPNSQGSGVGGWLQFMPGTWAGFYRHAVEDVRSRGWRVPGSSASWYSPLGQALAGAWGITHGMQHHWAGRGCW